jgi:hypothetical protein
MTTAKASRKLWPITVSSISLPADHTTLLFDAADGDRGSNEDGGNRQRQISASISF